MPELPEVTVIVNGLDKKIKGLVLAGVRYDVPKGFIWGSFAESDLKGAEVKSVERRGKVILINLSKNQNVKKTKDLVIMVHLKLTGQLIYQDEKTRIAGGHPIPPLNLPVPNKTTRAIFEFTNGAHLYFNDLRKFGWVKIVENNEEEIKKAIGSELGPDPLLMKFSEFQERLKLKGKRRIKQLLMDQSFVSGIGNIYSDEALWRARVHPEKIVATLSDLEIKAVFRGILESMKLSIEKGGSSANSYVGTGGEKGLYLSFSRAYHMIGKPCFRCGNLIVGKKMNGRTAHFCPFCQKQ